MLFTLVKHYLELNITDTALKVFRSLYCFSTSISHGVENYFPRLWGTGISDATFFCVFVYKKVYTMMLFLQEALDKKTCKLKVCQFILPCVG